jgi:hypothetical protein
MRKTALTVFLLSTPAVSAFAEGAQQEAEAVSTITGLSGQANTAAGVIVCLAVAVIAVICNKIKDRYK